MPKQTVCTILLREMNIKLNNLVTAHYALLARSFVIALGCIAVWWGISELPLFWQDSTIEKIATQIIAGDPFKIETLAQQLPIIDSIEKSAFCRPAALRSAAIIRLRMLEMARSDKDGQRSDEQSKSVANLIRSSLSCAPADPFLWLALYLVEVNAQGLKPDYLKYLRLSYRLGPHEGWIALKRNPLAFTAFQQLTPDLGEAAVNEFVTMLLDLHFSDSAAEILIGPAWPQRELILPHLSRLTDYQRQAFAEALIRRGYDLNVPGIGLAPVESHRFAPQIRVPQ
jgi:hypothetical protein